MPGCPTPAPPCSRGRARVGRWMVGDRAAGLCLRESDGLITTDRARFVPHLIAP
ncbi:glutathionylspermidine synthase family protein [Methylobacterium radiotolerans]|uniref:glutathionylspermidine synthase family protein n=1 Tax=Methylobacterium radiotolerans TaxID=31998 RepID=UPI003F672102